MSSIYCHWISMCNVFVFPVLVTLVCELRANHLSANLYDVSASGSGHIVQYAHYTEKVSFNEARAACLAIGGDLAKVESSARKSAIKSSVSGGSSIFSDHLWVGLAEKTKNNPFWVSDCSTDIDNSDIEGDWDSSKRCMILKSGTYLFDMKECENEEMFLCELYTYITQSATKVHPSYTSSSKPDDHCTPYQDPTTTTTTTLPTTSTTTTSSTTSTTSTTTTSTSTTTTHPSIKTSTTTVPTTSTTTRSSTTTANVPTTSTIRSTTSTTTTPSTTQTSTTTTSTTTTSTTQPPTTQSSTSTASTILASVTSTSTQSSELCFCDVTATGCYSNVTLDEAEKIAAELSESLTILANSTSSHRRRLTSASDDRVSAQAIGYVGLMSVTLPVTILVVLDAQKIVQAIKVVL